MPRATFLLRTMAPCLAMLAGSGCADLNTVIDAFSALDPPQVALQEVTLAETPTQASLRAYFCPRVLAEQGGALALGAEIACSQLFGPAPSEDQMKVSFDVRLNVQNPNRVPLPLSSVLTALTVYPGQQTSELGAACVSLCSPDDPECGARDEHACPTGATDITRSDQLAPAFGKVLLAEGARLASGQGLGLEPPEVVAEGALDMVVRLALDPRRLLPVMQQLARQSVDQLRAGQPVSFAIPYQLRGNLFTSPLGSAGTLSAPYGPLDGSFTPR